MIRSIQLYGILGLLLLSIGLGGSTWYLWSRNSSLKTELEASEITRKKAQENLLLVSEQLSRERAIRQQAQQALDELRNVPDEDANQRLPDSISDVLDRFHRGLQ